MPPPIKALLATAAFRGTTLAALSSAVDNLADLGQQTYAAPGIRNDPLRIYSM
jgi:hypothetical protein